MLQLHYFPGNASLAPHILLEEIGAPFELLLVDRTQSAQKSPAYLALNPNGLIPVLTVAGNDLVLYEAAAICLHLCDTHAGVHLAPPVGSVQRARDHRGAAREVPRWRGPPGPFFPKESTMKALTAKPAALAA